MGQLDKLEQSDNQEKPLLWLKAILLILFLSLIVLILRDISIHPIISCNYYDLYINVSFIGYCLLTIIYIIRRILFCSKEFFSFFVLFAICASWIIPVQFINNVLDMNPSSCHDALVIDKDYESSVRFGPFYNVTIKYWKKDTPVKFNISHDIYDSVIPNVTVMSVCTKPGLFGWEWITSCRIKNEAVN
jgi:hypothetical protein